jgi:hypothetical protein
MWGLRRIGSISPVYNHSEYNSLQSALNAADVLATNTNADYEVCEFTGDIYSEWALVKVIHPGPPMCAR